MIHVKLVTRCTRHLLCECPIGQCIIFPSSPHFFQLRAVIAVAGRVEHRTSCACPIRNHDHLIDGIVRDMTISTMSGLLASLTVLVPLLLAFAWMFYTHAPEPYMVR